MSILLSIDPGMSTGVFVGVYTDEDPLELGYVLQIPGGVQGFLSKVSTSENGYGDLLVGLRYESAYGDLVLGEEESITVIAEKFTARSTSRGGFSYRTNDLEPLRVEGAMLAMGLNPTWVSPAQQYFAGGEGKAKKKQAQHRWLKEHGLYVTGKAVGGTDADDVRSAMAHAVAYLVRQKHRPTIEHYFPKEDEDA